jgi:hypothetical protein
MKSASTTVETTIEATREKTFLHIVPIDLTSIFTGYGPLPSVTGTLNATGPWDAEDQRRTVVFSDGSSAQEHLTSYEYPNCFAYRITGFTGVMRLLVSEARGEWWFEKVPGRTGTSVRWRYEFISRSAILRPLVSLFTRSLWRGYMSKALRLSKAQLETLA